MRITPISLNNFYRPVSAVNNHNDYSQGIALRPALKCDTVSFTGGVPNGDILKRLLPYRIPDMYTGRIMMSPEEIQRFLKRKVFSSSLRNIVKTLMPFEECLNPVNKSILNILQTAAKTSPKKNLEEVLHELAAEHQLKLRTAQQPIFDKLTEQSKEMPEDLRQEFDAFMEYTQKKLSNMPVVVDFSAKEFQYKLHRAAEGINRRGIFAEQSTIRKLIRLSGNFSVLSEEETYEKAVAKNKIKSKNKSRFIQKYRQKQAEVLRQMDRVLMTSPLYDDKELNDLFVQTRFRIYKIPQIYTFNRKSFIHDLKKILNKLDDIKLQHRMIQTALKLPTSKENLSAFIVKAADYSSEKIGFELIYGSMGSIEHLTPTKRGGEDVLANYALASVDSNGERGHRSFEEQLKRHPETYMNAQKYVDRLIELYNDGTFSRLGLHRGYIQSFASKLYKMSPKEKPLVLDLSKLKP